MWRRSDICRSPRYWQVTVWPHSALLVRGGIGCTHAVVCGLWLIQVVSSCCPLKYTVPSAAKSELPKCGFFCVEKVTFVFNRGLQCGLNNIRAAPLLHQTNCPTLHLRSWVYGEHVEGYDSVTITVGAKRLRLWKYCTLPRFLLFAMMLILLAILTMVNMNWLGNLGNFQLRCCLAHPFCVDDQLASHIFSWFPTVKRTRLYFEKLLKISAALLLQRNMCAWSWP